MNQAILSEPETIAVRRCFSVSRDRIVAAFQKREALEAWFAPDPGIAIRITEFSFRVGGRFRISYEMPDGMRRAVWGRYKRLNLPDDLAFTWQWEEPDEHAGIETLVQVSFVERGEATDVILTHSRLDDVSLRERHRLGWEGTFANLDAHLTVKQSGNVPHD